MNRKTEERITSKEDVFLKISQAVLNVMVCLTLISASFAVVYFALNQTKTWTQKDVDNAMYLCKNFGGVRDYVYSYKILVECNNGLCVDGKCDRGKIISPSDEFLKKYRRNNW